MRSLYLLSLVFPLSPTIIFLSLLLFPCLSFMYLICLPSLLHQKFRFSFSHLSHCNNIIRGRDWIRYSRRGSERRIAEHSVSSEEFKIPLYTRHFLHRWLGTSWSIMSCLFLFYILYFRFCFCFSSYFRFFFSFFFFFFFFLVFFLSVFGWLHLVLHPSLSFLLSPQCLVFFYYHDF